ncbi:EAL domain-containing protein [Halopseudomonas oceani]|uniref:putative bifunctional diguanylate cyclase/phosphodiesterase n=1 Tax=Halopseudomonas oceani TaxID=1708783 RepID=UPI002AA74C46|nr:EAL domain-containing protein [Halopseudomonas oceani]
MKPYIQTFDSLRNDIALMYSSDEREVALLRGAHLTSVIRVTPAMMFANFGAGACILLSFSPEIPSGLWVWFSLLTMLCILATLSWKRMPQSGLLTSSVRRIKRSTLHAAGLSGIWAVMIILWFPSGGSLQQMSISTLVTGMIGAGGFVLSPLPRASVIYVGLYTVGSLIALLLTGKPHYIALALLLFLYSPMVVIGSLLSWRKSTDLINAQRQAARQGEMLSVLLQDFELDAGDALWETDQNGMLNHVSPRLTELLDLAPAEHQRKRFLDLLIERCPELKEQANELIECRQNFRSLPLTLEDSRGVRHLTLTGKILLDDQGHVIGRRGILSDVTDKVNNERMLQTLAHTDSLTGLANRFKLRDTISGLVKRNQSLALLSVDLDRFKSINDNHGHSTGDALLQVIARRLISCASESTLVARLGGDEFALVVWPFENTAEITALAQRLVDSLREPVTVAEREFRVGASIGISLRRPDGPHLDDLMVQSDMALYTAKAAGRGCWSLYSTEMGERSRRRLAIEEGLRQAIERGEIHVHWQPKVDLTQWKIVGAEALIRWSHPRLGRIGPDEFIPIAEQAGLIESLGHWVLEEACRAAVNELQGLTVSVNVSAMQVQYGHFLADLKTLLQRYQLAPQRLELELTESVIMDDPDQALAMLHAIRETGVRLALDDFGTGYSSLSYLRRFPFDTLKIDRSFITELLTRQDAQAIVRMITELAITLGKRTVCEGVETAEQLDAICATGCNEVQGYLISPPVPLSAFPRSLPERPNTVTAATSEPQS